MVAGGKSTGPPGREKGIGMMRMRSWSCIGVIVWVVGAATTGDALHLEHDLARLAGERFSQELDVAPDATGADLAALADFVVPRAR